MLSDLPFSLREPFSEIADSESDRIWEIFEGPEDVQNLLYRPGTLTGGENPKKIYDVINKTFLNVSLSHTEISSLIFTGCFFEDCIFYRTVFNNLEFHGCSFKNCNFGKCKIKDTYFDPLSFSECLNLKFDANIGIHLFQQLMRNLKDLDQPDFYRGAEFMFRRFKRSETQYKINQRLISPSGGYTKIFLSSFLEFFFGYGVKISRLFWSTIVLFTFFGVMNHYFWADFGLGVLCEECIEKSWENSLYYTVISLSNLGYGDIVPSSSSGRIWASIQAIIGALWFAVTASMIFKRITSR